jgi:hypothetical protein
MTWLAKYGVKDFIDVPCGDGNWQGAIPGIAPDPILPSVRYQGFDIAPFAVEKAKAKNAANHNMSFGVLDLSAGVPPRGDAIMIRDAIQHVPLAMGMAMLVNAKASGTRYLIVATYDNGGNREVSIGSYYTNNVHAAPFNLPRALETCPNYDRIIGACATPRASCLSAMHLIDLNEWHPSE